MMPSVDEGDSLKGIVGPGGRSSFMYRKNGVTDPEIPASDLSSE